MGLNKVLLIGNVGKDPEVRHLESGTSVATFSLATTERSRDKNGETKDITEWHNIVVWRQLADFAGNYIRKGSQIYVEGKIRSRNWDDQNGVKHYVTEIQADSIQLLGRRENAAPQAGSPATQPSYQQVPAAQAQPVATTPIVSPADLTDDGPDDLPF